MVAQGRCLFKCSRLSHHLIEAKGALLLQATRHIPTHAVNHRYRDVVRSP
jgi:hypothetical protein